MKEVIVLQRDQQMEVELQEKSKWVRGVLKNIGLAIDDWAEMLTMNDIRKIKKTLKQLDIDIIDDSDAGIEIYSNNNLIAEWRRPLYILKENLKERNTKYRYYLEMHLKCNSVFDTNAEVNK